MEPKYGICFSLPLSLGMEMDFWMCTLAGHQWSPSFLMATPFNSKEEAEDHLESICMNIDEALLFELWIKQIPS